MWQRTLKSCFLSRFVEFGSAVSEEKSKMSHPITDRFYQPEKQRNSIMQLREISGFGWGRYDNIRRFNNISVVQRLDTKDTKFLKFKGRDSGSNPGHGRVEILLPVKFR